jgi:pimeloyl-ACP methyl ester carboxylesterase
MEQESEIASLDLGAYTLAYTDEGQGEPVVLVHGSASDYRTWGAQRRALAKDYRVVAYSRRYHWPNEPIPGGADYAMAEHVADLRQLLLSLDTGPAHLVGHSYGAFVCLLLAIEAPQLCRSLVLGEPPAITLFVSDPPKPAEMLKLFFHKPRTALAIAKFGVRGFGPTRAAAASGDPEEAMLIFGRAVLGESAFDRLSEERKAIVRANSIGKEFLGSGFPPLSSDAVRGLRLPVLLITGQESPALFHRLVDRLEDLLEASRRVEIPGASHISHEDNAEAYNAALHAFLSSQRPSGLG